MCSNTKLQDGYIRGDVCIMKQLFALHEDSLQGSFNYGVP